jgi:hypothetical protein
MSINESELKVTFYAKNAQREGHVEQLLMYATENKILFYFF